MSNPQLGFGAMRLALLNEEDNSSIDGENYKQMIDYYMEEGFNYFDTSYAYHNGSSEIGLCKYLVNRYPRDSFKIADKIPTWLLKSSDDNQKFLNIILERLSVDYLDLLLIHDVNEKSYPVAVKFGTFDFARKMKDEGVALKIGLSFHGKSDLLKEILEEYSDILDVVQLQINYLDWESNLIDSYNCYKLCEEYDIDVIVMEPIKGGTLSDLPEDIKQEFLKYNPNRSLVEWALGFASTFKNVKIVLSGMKNLKQMKENCKFFKEIKPLNDDEINFLLSIAKKINQIFEIQCSYCNYCLNECPESIPIPDYFELYNNEKLYSLASTKAMYKTIVDVKPTPSDCIICNSCVDICTQKLDIPDLLIKVQEFFEKD